MKQSVFLAIKQPKIKKNILRFTDQLKLFLQNLINTKSKLSNPTTQIVKDKPLKSITKKKQKKS